MSFLWKGNLVFVGFMGSGKSTVGRAMADNLNLEFLDTDIAISNRLGLSIPDIFSTLGEEAFRDAETNLLISLQGSEGQILATGGGMVLRDENWSLMRAIGPVVFLKVETEILKRRLLGETGRPLADGCSWDQLLERYEARIPHYLKADIVIEVEDQPPVEIVDDILQRLKQRNVTWKF